MAPAVVHQSSSVAQTEAIAASLVERLSRGGVVGLEGGLGAGKTQFVRGLVSALYEAIVIGGVFRIDVLCIP